MSTAKCTTLGYTTAVILNDMAVSMLENGRITQAAETFKDAIKILKQPQYLYPHEKTHKTLEKARRRGTSTESIAFLTQLKIISISSSSSLSDSFFSAHNQEDCDPSIALLRVDCEEDFEENDLELFIAVLFFNFAVTHLCQAMKLNKHQKKAKLLDAASELLSLSCQILSLMYEDSQDPFMLPKVVVASMTVLKTLVKTLELTGRFEEAISCASTLVHLSKVAPQAFEHEFMRNSQHAGAA